MISQKLNDLTKMELRRILRSIFSFLLWMLINIDTFQGHLKRIKFSFRSGNYCIFSFGTSSNNVTILCHLAVPLHDIQVIGNANDPLLDQRFRTGSHK